MFDVQVYSQTRDRFLIFVLTFSPSSSSFTNFWQLGNLSYNMEFTQLSDVSGNEDSVPCSRGPAPYHVYVQGKQRITELIRDHFEELHSPKTVTLILKKVTAIITENIVAEDVFEVSVEGARWSFPRQVFCERWPWILSAAAFCEGQGRQTVVNLDKTPCNSHLAFLATLEFVFGNSARIFSSSVENAILGIQIGSFMVLNGLVATLDNCFRTGELELSDDIVGGVLGLIDNISCHVLRTKCIALYLQRPGLLDEDFVTGRIGKHIWLDVVAMEKAMRSSPSKHWRFDRANPPTSYTELVQLCKESIDDQEFRLKNSETREFERGLHWDETAEIDPSQMAKLKAERREWLVRQKWVEGHKQFQKKLSVGEFYPSSLQDRGEKLNLEIPRLRRLVSNEGREILQSALQAKWT